jgi:hypothetical protein
VCTKENTRLRTCPEGFKEEKTYNFYMLKRPQEFFKHELVKTGVACKSRQRYLGRMKKGDVGLELCAYACRKDKKCFFFAYEPSRG